MNNTLSHKKVSAHGVGTSQSRELPGLQAWQAKHEAASV
jgi:hypothetical protein